MWTSSSEDQDCGSPVHPVETLIPEDDERTNIKTTGQVLKNNGQVCGVGRGGIRLPSSDIASRLAPSRIKLADTEEESFKTFVALDLCLLLEMYTGEVMTCVGQWGTHPRKQVTQTPSKR